MLAHSQPGVGDGAGELLIAQARQHQIPRAFLGGCAAGAGFEVLAEVVDAQDKAPELLCDRLQHVHDGLADRIVVFIAGPAIACTGGNGIDAYQPQRQPEFFLE